MLASEYPHELYRRFPILLFCQLSNYQQGDCWQLFDLLRLLGPPKRYEHLTSAAII